MIGNIAAYCGLILGSSLRSDGLGESMPFHTAGSSWSKPMYSCAMSLKAIIKSVTFSYNTTADFAGLAVRSIEDKKYDNEAEYPIWAVENLSDMGQFWMMPLWGLVSREVADNFTHDQLRTVQKPFLFLPRRTTLARATGPSVQSHQNLAGIEFPDAGLDAIPSMAVGALGTMDYTGEGNLALAQKWSTLSKSAESMTRALDLVWTDYAANAVVGTKGSPGLEPGSAILRPVATYRTAIRYDLTYAVPAIMILAILALISALVLASLLLGRTTVAKMKRYLNATSCGRSMVSAKNRPPTAVDNDTPTKEWIESQGRTSIIVGKTMRCQN